MKDAITRRRVRQKEIVEGSPYDRASRVFLSRPGRAGAPKAVGAVRIGPRPGAKPSIGNGAVGVEVVDSAFLIVEASAAISMPLGTGIVVRPIVVGGTPALSELPVAVGAGEGPPGGLS